MDISVKKPTECSDSEVSDFMSFVLAGGEVVREGLEKRIRGAAFLLFLTKAQCTKGIAAVKQPSASYRRSVSSKAGVALPAATFPYELGWVFVLPSARGHGHSKRLVKTASSLVSGFGIFATSRTDNPKMHKGLKDFGFLVAGKPYKSDRGRHQLQLFIRTAAQQALPADGPRAARSARR